MMRQILFVGLLLFSLRTYAQNLAGDWKGTIDINGNQLPILFHFSRDASGAISGTWDSPKQNANGLPFTSIEVNKDSIHLGIKMINGNYRGRFAGADSIAGIWSQNFNGIPLNFVKFKGKPAPLLYPGEKEISVVSAGGSKLYGTLLEKSNTQPMAIIIAGSGPTDRDGNSAIAPHTNEYKMLAHALNSQGVATFRYDKRGIGKSVVQDFNESDLVFDDYVKDAEKIFDYLDDSLGFKNIYFVGHSEGSLIGMLASQVKKAKGYISVAGAGRPIDVVLTEQMDKAPLPDSVKRQIPELFNSLKEGKEIGDVPKVLDPLFRKSIRPYMIAWLKYDPAQEIKKLKCPVLIIQGSCDIQVQMVDAENLRNADRKAVYKVIDGMTHTLKNAGKDCAQEQKTYTDPEMPIDRDLVKDIAGFINK